MPTALTDWTSFRTDGEQLLAAATGGRKRPAVFAPPITFNLAAMAIENLSMAILAQRGDLADNHTIRDLVHALERHVTLPAELRADLLDLERFEDLCPIAPIDHDPITAADVPRILATARAFRAFAVEQFEAIT